jgi:hypothetical protein
LITRFYWSRVALMRSARPRRRTYWHLKDMGDLLQPAGPDAVGAVLVFLHLLEGEAAKAA